MKKRNVLTIILVGAAVVMGFYFSSISVKESADAVSETVSEVVADERVELSHSQSNFDIQQAIDLAVENGGGDVHVPSGKYYLNQTIIVKPTITLQLNSGAMLIPKRNNNVIELKRNSAINGGIIYVYDLKGFTQSAIYLDGAERFSGTLKSAEISNIKIIGRQGEGNGIFFHAREGSDHISWVQATNLNITGFEKSIFFKTEPIEKPQKIWINGNNFSQILIKDSVYGIYIDGHQDLPYEISGNTFTNVQIQTTSETQTAIFVKGTKNYIQAMIWDYHVGAEAIRFDEDSLRNQIHSNVSVTDSALIDEGIDNLSLSAN